MSSLMDGILQYAICSMLICTAGAGRVSCQISVSGEKMSWPIEDFCLKGKNVSLRVSWLAERDTSDGGNNF